MIFWGSNWNSIVGSPVKNAVKSMYEGISGSAWQGILTQYFDKTGNIGLSISVNTYVDTSVSAPSSVNDEKIKEEVASAIKANGWTREANAQFAVLPAPSTTYQAGFGSGLCGCHGVDKSGSSYAFVPYVGDEPFTSCRHYDAKEDISHATSMIASHEYAESATDPSPNSGWVDSEGFENADICSSGDDQLPNGTWVQGTWDNHENACSLSDSSPPQVYARTEAATAIGTTEATLNGLVNPEGRETTAYFKWGGVVLQNETGKVSVGSGRSNVATSKTITGLKSGETYFFVAVASNSTGSYTGTVGTFKTK